MMPEVPDGKPVKVKVPRATDDFMIVDLEGNAYQGLDSNGKPRFGHPGMGELFRHKATAETLAAQTRINGGSRQNVSILPTSQVKFPRYH